MTPESQPLFKCNSGMLSWRVFHSRGSGRSYLSSGCGTGWKSEEIAALRNAHTFYSPSAELPV